MSLFLVLLIAYLMGSIPSSVWYSKLFFKKDVRDFGSGNAGLTNTVRLVGFKKAIPVLLVDLLKGFFAVYIAQKYFPNDSNYIILSGILVIVGHIFPIFAGFRGGKGVLTSLGVVLALFPPIAIVSLIIFLIVFKKYKIVSIASLSAASVFLLLSLIDFLSIKYVVSDFYYMLFSGLMVAVIFITHRKNIVRLVKKEELAFKKSENKNQNSRDNSNIENGDNNE